ncbi:MAG: molybdopterin molybdotransferase MoeA [Gammaproteobacteria bacterium]|nr:molybdopterin molybdotransferase MoeA [Gammaproteobacteria bacterium]MBU1654940.1 molybdopterin molybdotransferase MoeA [Gammaproteobacteria bacterium]MBU1960492.1 molybdopterin molybdotransferase MoeA [Gammaproteobacteria bacterium]
MRCYDEAIAQLLAAARPLAETETLPTGLALGRILAAPVASSINVPAWDNSAMDGYAVRAQDIGASGSRLPVSQRIPAGKAGGPLQAGTAARIFTGAPVPPGADTVVIQEVCDQEGDAVIIKEPPKPGANVRKAGEDIKAGQTILQPGIKLAPQHLGLAASVGIAEVRVYRRLRVALFASGDELVMPGEPLGPGQIYNSNQFTASGLLQALGCEVIPLGIVEDNLEATCNTLARGAAEADLVVASGGVSVGEEDHVKPAVEKLGSLDLWKIAIRPGKPVAFGHIGQTPFIGTPGNPVSLFVTFLLFARPFILKMQGASNPLPTPLTLEAGFDWPKPDKRREYARGRLELGPDGKARVNVFPSRSSGVLSSVAWANGLAVILENQTLKRGDPVQFLSFAELLS